MARSPLLPLIYGRLDNIKVIKSDLKDAIEEKEEDVTTFDTYDDAVRDIKIFRPVNVLYALQYDKLDGHLYAIPSSDDQEKAPYTLTEEGHLLITVGEGDTIRYYMENGHLIMDVPEGE